MSEKRDPKVCPQCGDPWGDHNLPEPMKEHTITLLADPELDTSEAMLSLGNVMNTAAQMLGQLPVPQVQSYLFFYADIVAASLKRRDKIELLRKDHGK